MPHETNLYLVKSFFSSLISKFIFKFNFKVGTPFLFKNYCYWNINKPRSNGYLKNKYSRIIETSHSRLQARWKDDGQLVHSLNLSASPQTRHHEIWTVTGCLFNDDNFWIKKENIISQHIMNINEYVILNHVQV